MSKGISRQDNFVWLLASLVLLLFTSALTEQLFEGGQSFVLASLIFCLAISVVGIEGKKRWYKTGLGSVVLVVLLTRVGTYIESLDLDILALLAILAFFLTATWRAARQVLFTGKITGNKIIGSICIFLLLGLIWAIFYLILNKLFVGAFNGLPEGDWVDNLPAAIYYSFVTLTTVGYGEITPALPLPRFFAYMEAIAAQFYMAILVASLVGAKMSQE